MSEREERFEEMLRSVLGEYEDTVTRMERMRAEGKVKTATYRQLTGNKLTLQAMLARYEEFGLLGGLPKGELPVR